jgi:hypothetical protein
MRAPAFSVAIAGSISTLATGRLDHNDPQPVAAEILPRQRHAVEDVPTLLVERGDAVDGRHDLGELHAAIEDRGEQRLDVGRLEGRRALHEDRAEFDLPIQNVRRQVQPERRRDGYLRPTLGRRLVDLHDVATDDRWRRRHGAGRRLLLGKD